MAQKIALYPGSFDGLTNGHLDLIQRSSRIFDKVVVAIAKNELKTPLFTIKERLTMLREITGHLPNVEIAEFTGLTVDYARQIGAKFVIRGLRAVSDFEYELQLAMMNQKLAPEVETIFMAPATEYLFISSGLVKEVLQFGGDIKEFVPAIVEKFLRKKLSLEKK